MFLSQPTRRRRLISDFSAVITPVERCRAASVQPGASVGPWPEDPPQRRRSGLGETETVHSRSIRIARVEIYDLRSPFWDLRGTNAVLSALSSTISYDLSTELAYTELYLKSELETLTSHRLQSSCYARTAGWRRLAAGGGSPWRPERANGSIHSDPGWRYHVNWATDTRRARLERFALGTSTWNKLGTASAWYNVAIESYSKVNDTYNLS